MKINNETKVGIMVFAALGILLALTFKTGKWNFSKNGYYVKIQFKDIDGVNLKSPVMYNGYEVGVVEDIIIKDDPVNQQTIMELVVWLENEVRLRKGTKAYVKNLGFMGEKYVGLTSGRPGGAHLQDGATLVGEIPVSFDKLVADGQDIAQQLKKISTNVNERLQKNKENLDEILSNVNLTTKNMSSLVGNLDERLKTNKDNIDGMISRLHSLSVNMDELSADLKDHPWKLLYKPKRNN